ncbi:hypothetical protein BSLG_003704 [Batrachochytrium salamandrivorans]|nr:hypothetical protein BSLG_003704 [Batrachochytrium salamandrivorans]
MPFASPYISYKKPLYTTAPSRVMPFEIKPNPSSLSPAIPLQNTSTTYRQTVLPLGSSFLLQIEHQHLRLQLQQESGGSISERLAALSVSAGIPLQPLATTVRYPSTTEATLPVVPASQVSATQLLDGNLTITRKQSDTLIFQPPSQFHSTTLPNQAQSVSPVPRGYLSDSGVVGLDRQLPRPIPDVLFNRYANAFLDTGVGESGVLDPKSVGDIWLRSRLSWFQLASIWLLVDVEPVYGLTLNQFVIGLFLVDDRN